MSIPLLGFTENIYQVIVLLAATEELMAQVYSNCRCQRQISGSDAQARSFEAIIFSRLYKTNQGYQSISLQAVTIEFFPFFPTTPSVSPRQGAKLTRPDPWPQKEGTLHRVPVIQVEPSCTGLMPVSSTTLCQLNKALFRLGCLLLSLRISSFTFESKVESSTSPEEILMKLSARFL